MVFDVRAATIEGEPQEMAEFVMAIERLQTEEAVREWESMMSEEARAEPEPREKAAYFEPENGTFVLLKDGEVVYVLEVDLDEEDVEVAKVGDGANVYKLIGFEDIVRLATEDEKDEQSVKNRGV